MEDQAPHETQHRTNEQTTYYLFYISHAMENRPLIKDGSIYTKEGRRCDIGAINHLLYHGGRIVITPATKEQQQKITSSIEYGKPPELKTKEKEQYQSKQQNKLF